MKAMRRVFEPDGSPTYEEVVVLELGHGEYSVVRQVSSGRSFRVLKSQVFPYDQGMVSR